MVNCTEKNGDLIFNVRVVPQASKSEIVGSHDGALKIRIAVPPVDGAANSELIKLLAQMFDVSKSAIEIVGGQTSKAKQVKLCGVTPEQFSKISNL